MTGEAAKGFAAALDRERETVMFGLLKLEQQTGFGSESLEAYAETSRKSIEIKEFQPW